MAAIAIGLGLALVAVIHRVTRSWQVRGQMRIQHVIGDPFGVSGINEKNALLTWWVGAVALLLAAVAFIAGGVWMLFDA